MRKLLLIILDGVPYRNWRRLFGNLEGWVAQGEARVWRMRATLPSTSASCYASIHTGVPPHCTGSGAMRRCIGWNSQTSSRNCPRRAARPGPSPTASGRNCSTARPFDLVRDIEYDEAEGPITHGRFHTMTGYGNINQMTPSDVDLFATLTRLCRGEGHRLRHPAHLHARQHGPPVSSTIARKWTMPAM